MIILAADIGGTNSRFAAFEKEDEAGLCLRKSLWLPTGSVDDFGQLVDQLAQSELADWMTRCTAVVIAVPGPVRGGNVPKMPHVSWSLSTVQLQVCFSQVPRDNVHLVNDFVAQALACRTLAMSDAICIQPGEKDPAGVVSVIGAGTGIGSCSLAPDGNEGWVVLPSEAGHQSFSFRTGDERRYEDFLLKEMGRTTVINDMVVTGRGLAMLHRFVTGEDLLPQDVAARLNAESEVSRKFATFYGRAARNYALSVLPTGGLVVTGGVAAKNHFLVDHDAFREEFSDVSDYRELLEKIPIRLNVNEESGIWGAAAYAVMMSEKRARRETPGGTNV